MSSTCSSSATRRARVPRLLDPRRQLVANSSCGVCGRATIEELRRDIAPLAVQPAIALDFVRTLPSRLRETQPRSTRPAGCTAPRIFARTGRLLSSAEDVGRHNAVDKAIGRLLLERRLRRTASTLSPSAAASRSRSCRRRGSAVSGHRRCVGADHAWRSSSRDEAGITLIGFARGDSLNIYTHEARIAGV